MPAGVTYLENMNCGREEGATDKFSRKKRKQRNAAALISSLAPKTVWVRSSRGQLDLGSKSTF